MKHRVEITGLAYGGDGIGRIDGQVCFVPFGLPGDVLSVEITRKAKGVLWGRIAAVEAGSEHRLAVEDGHAGRCGGCQWLHFAYPEQGAWKQRLITEALARYAGLEVAVEWREDPALRLGWRTRAELHGDGERLGFFAQGSHEIVETPCPLLHAKLAAAVARLRGVGWRGEVELTVNPEGEEVLAFGRGPTREAREVVTAWDTPRGEDMRTQFVFDGAPIVNGCFSQSSLLLNRLLRATVAEMVTAEGAIFDAYCGNGNLSLAYLPTREVAGVDASEGAVAAAAALGGDYRVGDEWAMVVAIKGQRWGTVLMDPPRAGAKALVPALVAAQAEELVYVSCDPVALARDLKGLCAGGWTVARAVGLDLFPNTAHMETVVRLVR